MSIPETKEAFEEKYGCSLTISNEIEWNEMPGEKEICEVFVGDGLGFTEYAIYENGKWYSYTDLKRVKPLNVVRWRKDV